MLAITCYHQSYINMAKCLPGRSPGAKIFFRPDWKFRYTMSNIDEQPDLPEVDTPINLRPNLETFNIEEVDRGVCADTAENRKILRKHKMAWRQIYNSDGSLSPNIEVISSEMQSARAEQAAQDRAPILVDPKNLNSDYLSGWDLVAEKEADNLVPAWVLASTRKYVKYQDNPADNPKPKIDNPPTRCTAVKADGNRCLLWSAGRTTDAGLCRIHLGTRNMAAGVSVQRARDRIQQAAVTAADVIEYLLDSADSEQVRLKAATEILDRAGVRAGFEIDTTLTADPAAAALMISERLRKLAEGARSLEILETTARDIDEDENGEPSVEDSNIIAAEVVQEEDDRP